MKGRFPTRLKEKNTIKTLRKLRFIDLKCTNRLRRRIRPRLNQCDMYAGIVHLPFISAPRIFVTETVTCAGKKW